MDLGYAVTALGTAFADVASKVTQVIGVGYVAVAGTGLVFAALTFIINKYGIGFNGMNGYEQNEYDSAEYGDAEGTDFENKYFKSQYKKHRKFGLSRKAAKAAATEDLINLS